MNNDLEELKDIIKHFVKEHNVKYLGVDIEEKEYGFDRPEGENTYKDITIHIEY